MAGESLEILSQALRAQLRDSSYGDQIHLPDWFGPFKREGSDEDLGWLYFEFYPDETPVTTTPIEAAERFIANYVAVGEAIGTALIAALPKIHDVFADPADLDVPLPEPENVRSSVEPIHIFIHDVPDGDAVIGVEFNCDWDREHGLAVLLRNGQPLGVCLADAAFDTRTAQLAAKGEYNFFLWNAPGVRD